MPHRMLRSGAVVVAVAGLLAATAPTSAAPTSTGATGVDRPDGPVGSINGPLTAGNGINLVAANVPDLPDGWVEEEFTIAGTAVSYQAAGELPTDGTYSLDERDSADYVTRVVVRRPGSADDFNGTVVVEWLNVSAGLDSAPDYTFMGAEIVRGGYAWVGVSVQRIGVEGGSTAVSAPMGDEFGAGTGLRAIDPARYGELRHPGDAYAYDIFTHVARTLRTPGPVDPLGGLEPVRLIAVGQSQSGYALTTYANGIQPLARQYDAFVIHSRGGAAAPLGEPGAGIDMAGTIGGDPTTIRPDLGVPVLILESESDVLGILNFLPARQPDTEHIRVWEVAGTAHADAFQIGIPPDAVADMMGCTEPVNAGPLHFVAKAALRHVDQWAAGGEPPPSALPLGVDASASPAVFVRDANGNATGGVRTPLVDVAVDALSGAPVEGSSVICLLFGSTRPLPAERLAELYPTPEDYLAAFTASTDEAIAAGFVLPEDRDALLAAADPTRITG